MYVRVDANIDGCVCGEKENEKRVNKLIFGMKAKAKSSRVFHTPTRKKRISRAIALISRNLSVD